MGSLVKNIASTGIRVYPAVNRNAKESGDIYARHASEEFLAGIVNKLIDTQGFVITSHEAIDAAIQAKKDINFAFNINGYYFTILNLEDDLLEWAKACTWEEGQEKNLYAYIYTENHGTWVELAGGDETSETGNEITPENPVESLGNYTYKCLSISNSYPVNSDPTKELFVLNILRKTPEDRPDLNWGGLGWYVPAESYIKFTGASFILDRVDGGDLSKLI